jgi:hypothetical protein
LRTILLIARTSDLATDLLILAAKKRRLPVVRLNQDEFPTRTCIEWASTGSCRLTLDHRVFGADEVGSAWYRKPRSRDRQPARSEEFTEREASGFLEGVWATASWGWMNRPSAVALAELKLAQLRRAHAFGFALPDTLVTNDPGAARRFAQHRPIIAKTVMASGVAIDGVDQAIFTTALGREDLHPDAAIQACPVIFQRRIPTQFDLRVTVVGSRVFASRISITDRTHQDVDWRTVESSRLVYEHEALPVAFETMCIRFVQAFGLAYGALDFVVSPEGERIFLEINPSGQWGWIERALGLPITDSILDALLELDNG